MSRRRSRARSVPVRMVELDLELARRLGLGSQPREPLQLQLALPATEPCSECRRRGYHLRGCAKGGAN